MMADEEEEVFLLEVINSESDLEDKHGDTPVEDSSSPPRDNYYLVYFVILLVSMGILFPYNSIVVAIDYFLFLYPTKKPEFVFPFVYLTVTLLFVTFTISTVNVFPIHGRIGFGYFMFSIALLFVPLLDIGIHNCTVSTELGFILTLGAIVVISIGSGVQQTSYYGLAGMLPERYTQSMMLGESVAGTVVAINRIITKASATSERAGAIIFFVISILYMIFCVGCQVFLFKSSFVRYHVKENSKHKFHTLSCFFSSKKKTSNMENNLTTIDDKIKREGSKSWDKKLEDGLVRRLRVIRKIWKLALSVFLTFLVTLLVFPGLISDVQYCTIGDWSPIILITLFSFTDAISRIIAILPYRLNSNWLIVVALLRFILVPLLVLCVTPSPTNPIISSSLWVALVLISLIGFTNGYFGTLGMQYPPTMVEDNDRELTGTIMVFFLLGGLTLGSILANGWAPLTRLTTYSPCFNFTADFFCHYDDNNNMTLLIR